MGEGFVKDVLIMGRVVDLFLCSVGFAMWPFSVGMLVSLWSVGALNHHRERSLIFMLQS